MIKETLKQASLEYKQNDAILFSNMTNGLAYFLAFLLGLGLVLIGEALFMFPVAGYAMNIGKEVTEVLVDTEGYIALASKVLVTTLILIFLLKILKKDAYKLKKSWLDCLIISIIGFGIIVGISFLFDYLSKTLNIEQEAVNETSVLSILEGKSGVVYAICIVTLTPFCEEIVFRKLSFSMFKSAKLPRIVTTLLVALIFALIHCLGEDITSLVSYYHFLQYFLLSLALTGVYALTNENIYASTFVHILNNALGLLLFII